MKRPIATLLSAAALLLALAGEAPADVDLPQGFQDSVAIEGLEEPTTFRFAGDGRVFVAEKAGRVLVFDDLGDETPTLFADLRTNVYDAFDRGLLGMALDPEFPERPYVYVLYTYDHELGAPGGAPRWGEPDQAGDECPEPKGADDCLVSGRLARLTAVGNQMTAEDVLIEDWCQQFSSHSIGDLEFADGALYASGGEGASWTAADYGQFGEPKNPCGDPPGGVGGQMKSPTAEGGALRAQDLRTPADPTGLDGTVVRVDPDTGAGLAGNPMFSSGDANARRVVAYGLRNPFRLAIDPRTDEVYAGNVGWGEIEEIDRFAAVPSQIYNSGWPCYEGDGPGLGYSWIGLDICEDLYDEPGSTAPPFFEYDHGSGVSPEDPCPPWAGSAISGIAINDGSAFPDAYDGALFFADSVRGCIYAMLVGEDERPDPATVFPFATDAGLYPGVDLQIGPDGALYYVSMFSQDWGPGSIHRVEYFSGNQPPIAKLAADPEWGLETSLEVDLDASESSDPDGDPLAYEWDLDDDGEFDSPSSESTATETYEGPASHEVSVRVADPDGGSSIARVTVYPAETPPQPQILTPSEDFEWAVGDEIEFEGEASDAQDGDLPATSLDWSARLLHCPDACHPHSLPAFPAVASGSFTVPDHDYPTWVELTLTAKDSRSLSGAVTTKFKPRTVDLAIDSEPSGLSLGAGLIAAATPFVLPAIEGSNVALVAPKSQERDGLTYTWEAWSDGGERVHQVIADESGAYTASYRTDAATSGSASAATIQPARWNPFLRLRTHRTSRRGTARFAFSVADDDARFLCKLDRGPFVPCRSPRVYRNLKPGRHAFRVIAVDSAGAPISKQAIHRWKVPAPLRRARAERLR
jgi:glucose/arabinose dehydrogenase